jgi:hypothetical protein
MRHVVIPIAAFIGLGVPFLLLASCTSTSSDEAEVVVPSDNMSENNSDRENESGANATAGNKAKGEGFPKSPPAEPLEKKPVAHLGPKSPFDKPSNTTKDQTMAGGFEASLERQWSCLSRTELTLCRGRNGAGMGQVLWIRYRGRLLAKTTAEVPVFVSIGVGSKTTSFPLRTNTFGASAFLTNGLYGCRSSTRIKADDDKVKTNCKKAPPAMKSFVDSLPTSAEEMWSLALRFGVTIQRTPKERPQSDIDAGTPPFVFDLPARVEAPMPQKLPSAAN